MICAINGSCEEEGKYPDLIVELTSPSTAKVDHTTKMDLYEKTFRTPEYYCYDPATEKLEGWQLDGGVYHAMQPDERGWLRSNVLQIWLGTWTGKYGYAGMDGTWLRFYDKAGQLLLNWDEAAQQDVATAEQQAIAAQQHAATAEQQAIAAQQQAEAAQQQAEAAQQQAEAAQQQAEAAQQQAEAAQQQAEAAQQRTEAAQRLAEQGDAEIARLKALLAQKGIVNDVPQGPIEVIGLLLPGRTDTPHE